MTLSDYNETVNFNDYLQLKQRYLEILSKFTFLIDAIPDMAFIIDRHGVFIEFYPGQDHETLFTREEILGKNLLETLPSDPSIGILHWIKEAIGTGQQFTYQFKFEKNGNLRDYEARGMRYSDNLVLLLVRDITVNEKIKSELIASEEKYRVLVENSQDLIWRLDETGKISYLNKAWEKSHGYKIGEMIGKLFTDFQTEEMSERDTRAFMRMISQETIKNYYTTHIAKNGSIIHLIFNASIIYDDDNNIVGLQGTAYDISYRKKMENELLKSSKLESLGILAGGIAHDFNNLLTGISGNVSLIQDIARNHPEIDILSSEVLEVVQKASKLTKQLLTFSKGGEPSKKPLRLKKLLTTTAQFVTRGSNVISEIKIDNNLRFIHADESQIDQVFQNIMINSIQAMRNGGILKITARNGLTDHFDQIKYKSRNYVTVEIEDQGIGMTTDDLERVLDPFYTTKPDGTGLGLTTAFSIIQRHKGDMRIESEVEKGTKVTIILPALDDAEGVISDEEHIIETDKLTHLSKRILVMDDDHTILNVYGRILSRLGCEYTLVKDGVSALEEYHAQLNTNNGYDGVILDLTIPGGMGGKETVNELKKMDPYVIAIVSSGYSDDPLIANYKEAGFSYKLEKPFSLTELQNLIENL